MREPKYHYRLREINDNDVVLLLYDKLNEDERMLIDDAHFMSVAAALRFIGENYPDAREEWPA